MIRTMTESLNSAELLKQLKSLGLEKLLHVTHKFLRQSYNYPPLLNFGGKTLLITFTSCGDVNCSTANGLLLSVSGGPLGMGRRLCWCVGWRCICSSRLKDFYPHSASFQFEVEQSLSDSNSQCCSTNVPCVFSFFPPSFHHNCFL